MTGPAPSEGALIRAVALAAMVLSITAATVFAVILLLGMDGETRIGRIFGPIGIVATVLGLIAAVWAVSHRETRGAGVVSLLILVPCVLLAFVSAVALLG